MIRDEQAFLAAIRATPDDDQLRLIYADWLEERGDVRGEFLRVRSALKALALEDERCSGLRGRLRELRPLIRAEWLAAVDRPFAEDDVREAVFRHQLRQGGPGGVCFLRVEGGNDPSADLLDRFRGHRPPVKPASTARRNDSTGELTDRDTGEWGTIFSINAVRWKAASKCEVAGGDLVDDEEVLSWTYQLELRDGQWRVTDVPPPMWNL
ncbi:MAG: TIGR02996 domain-containing protein [Gemmataceae bacterium]|nr:TIGR02996 domain-containing protein [Gemmataceae bacterium]